MRGLVPSGPFEPSGGGGPQKIGQPVPQTDVADLAATRAGIADTETTSTVTAIVSAVDAHRVAVEALRATGTVLIA